ncbi:hypothetical protein [Chamaesiphon sp.]|uniref:hypothetical protein n=1 Tax=Chamaesiphon sp. TaxID=2814140 RepID=UPI0035945C3C
MMSQSSVFNVFELDDDKLIEQFVQGGDRLLASANLRIEVHGGLSQLLARNGDPIAIMYLQNKPCNVIVKQSSPFLKLIDRLLIDRDFVMFGNASSRAGFIEYKYYATPAGYRIWYTEPAILWKKWWPTEKFQDKQRFNMEILVNFKQNWYPVQNIIVNAGIFTIKTIAGQLELKREQQVLWLAQIMSENTGVMANIQPPVSTTNVGKIPAIIGSSVATPVDLAEKIHQKQLEINPDRAWEIIKKLEQRLQAQIGLNTEMEAKVDRLENRAVMVEQRLQVVYKYLQEIGVDPRDVYNGKKNTDN